MGGVRVYIEGGELEGLEGVKGGCSSSSSTFFLFFLLFLYKQVRVSEHATIILGHPGRDFRRRREEGGKEGGGGRKGRQEPQAMAIIITIIIIVVEVGVNLSLEMKNVFLSPSRQPHVTQPV